MDLLVPAQLGAALVQMTMSAAVFLAVRVFLDPPLGWAALSVPILILPYLMLTLGLSWLLASLGVYLRDLGQSVGVIVAVLMFMSPIFYPVSAVPEEFRPWLRLNPLTPAIEQAREVVIFGRLPDWWTIASMMIVGGVIAWTGLALFQRTRAGFADVL